MTDRTTTFPAWVAALAAGREPVWTPLVCALGAALGWLAARQGWPAGLEVGAWLAAYVAGGGVSFVRSVRSLASRRLDVDLLMLLSAAGAAAIGEYAEGAILLFLFSLSNALESRALRRTTRAIESLMELRPEEATRLAADGSEQRVAVDDLRPGEQVLVRPGERVPVDGRVHAGHTAVDQAAITGESMPVSKETGEAIFAGSINVGGTVTLDVERPAADSTLARIIRLVEGAREAKAPTQRFIDRFEQGYTATVLFATAAAIVVPILTGTPFASAFYRAMTLLVVASPCAVVISTPATILAALAHAASRGLLFKGGAPLEELAQLDVVAFDKTGTLTVGRPVVSAVIPLDGANADRVLALAAAVERLSEHHLGRAIVERATELDLAVPTAANLRNVRGQGAVAEVEGGLVAVGRSEFAAREGGLAGFPAATAAELQAAGKTLVFVAGRGVRGVVAIEDQVRPGAAAAIAALRSVGVERTLLLTGDNPQAAARVAAEVGIEEWRAGLMPEDKVAVLKELTASGARVAMVGDGVNDAPALAAATLGVAMGITGTDAALETADLVLVRDELDLLAYAARLARRARRLVRQNLVFACGVIALLVVVNLSHGLALPLGVLGHEGSTILVVLNGLRVLRPLKEA
jgi:Cd2+/Zn2+-exporting ATPase